MKIQLRWRGQPLGPPVDALDELYAEALAEYIRRTGKSAGTVTLGELEQILTELRAKQ